MFHTLAPWRFVFHTLGPRGTPHPLLHTGIFLTNGSKDPLAMDYCGLRFSALRGANIDASFILCKKYYHFYHCKFRVCAVCPFLYFHTVGFHPLERLEALRAFSHAGTALWRFHTLGPGGTPPDPSSILGAPIDKPPCGSELLHALCL